MKMLKQKDIIILVVSVIAGIILAIVAGKYAFDNSSYKNTQVDQVPTIHSDFPAPSSQYFNNKAVDPTQIINISPNNSQQPFGASATN